MNKTHTQLPEVQPGPAKKINWLNSHYLWGYAFLALTFLLIVSLIYQLEYSAPEKSGVCVQVITKAKNSQTGEIKVYPTPCDVPAGWEEVKSEPNHIELDPSGESGR